MRRLLAVLLILVLLAINVWAVWAVVRAVNEPNPSHDGRYHTCGLVTEDGVTDHLAEYRERCMT